MLSLTIARELFSISTTTAAEGAKRDSWRVNLSAQRDSVSTPTCQAAPWIPSITAMVLDEYRLQGGAWYSLYNYSWPYLFWLVWCQYGVCSDRR
ncbi:hypothetical protein RRG08_059351 [Elysia crispata]|uniref:Uncharacterized protein n=1 Tax=Elysia crispata TaxID=231223 RepID=A0AAE1BG74_9GAST|nr:hypothetical protein RRG08_059351 [Elysia crispata]